MALPAKAPEDQVIVPVDGASPIDGYTLRVKLDPLVDWSGHTFAVDGNAPWQLDQTHKTDSGDAYVLVSLTPADLFAAYEAKQAAVFFDLSETADIGHDPIFGRTFLTQKIRPTGRSTGVAGESAAREVTVMVVDGGEEVAITVAAAGPAGPAGPQGDPGEPGAPGVGVPDGGMTGQMLAKISDVDDDTGWADPPSVAGVDPVAGDVPVAGLVAALESGGLAAAADLAAEAAARIAADTALASAVAAETTRAEGAEGVNAAAVAAETARAEGVEAVKADLVAGKVPTSQLPAIATFTTHTVASQAAMLALSAAVGDVAIRTDLTNARYLLTALPPATLGNWLLIDSDPTAGVDTVNGQHGTVVLGPADVGADASGAASTAQAAAITAAASDATTKANAAQAASQPLDSDLTAIAALSTTTFGRALLALADAAALRASAALGSLATVTPTGTPDGTKFLRDDDVWAAPAGGSLGWYDITASPYSAVPGRAVYDAVTNGSATVTSATAAFTSGDVGKKVLLADAAGDIFTGTVLTVNSATSITLTANVTFTATSVSLALGTDSTAAIQQAINDVVAAGGGTILFSGAPTAVYLVLGAQVSGSVSGSGISVGQTFTYTGQILFPAQPFTASTVPVRLMGGTPPAQATVRTATSGPPNTGLTLLSNATTGAVFDSIPTPVQAGTWLAANEGETNLHGFFENLQVRICPGRPVKAVGARKLVGLNLASVTADTFTGTTVASSQASASSFGIDSPHTGNEGSLRYRDVAVYGHGVATTMTEHTDADGLFIQGCKVGLLMMGGGHLNTIRNGCIQGTDTMIKSNSGTGSRLVGDISIESPTLFIDDINGAIKGELIIHRGDVTPYGGLPNNGGWGLNQRVITDALPDFGFTRTYESPVREDFTRMNASATAFQNTGISQHVYEQGVSIGGLGVSGGKGVARAAAYGTNVVQCPFQSVVVRSRITLSSTTACIGVTPRDKQQNGYTVAVLLEKDGSNDRIAMVKWNGASLTTFATLEAAGLTLGSTYELAVVWNQPVKNGPAVITAYLDGVQKLTYTLTSGDQATFGSPVCVGLAQSLHTLNDDGGSRWLDFYAFPLDGVPSSAPLVENVNTVATSGSAQTIPDVTSDTESLITLTANCTLTFPTAVAGKSFTLALKQDGTGSRTVTWPGTVKWSGGTAPTLTTTAAKTDLFTFTCLDGTNWVGTTAGLNF